MHSNVDDLGDDRDVILKSLNSHKSLILCWHFLFEGLGHFDHHNMISSSSHYSGE